jgi:small subunit ribosomal protein S18
LDVDYKNTTILRNFITERGKMISARSTGNCAKHHRMLTRAIKRARNLALIPFAVV